MLSTRLWLSLVSFLLLLPQSVVGAERLSDQYIREAEALYNRNQVDEALAVVTKAINLDPGYPTAFYLRARINQEKGRHDRAIEDFTRVIKIDTNSVAPYQHRAEEYFRVAKFRESVADFDKVIELNRRAAPSLWQRGISLYYAGEFELGRQQFESHQTVNPNDVENAVWHFLCVARASGVEKARASLIPITGDTRVPMAKIHALFAGKAQPEDVLAETKTGGPSPDELKNREFYAHLYLGLYFEALKDSTKTKAEIFQAEKLALPDYMGDVARVHAKLLRDAKDKSAK